MAGIISYGAYIPLYRLSRQELARAWGQATIPGEKAIANADEDSLTMGVEAAIDCLGTMERQLVDGLFFATASPAYREKQNASIIAAAADLPSEVATADFGHSLRGGTTAFAAALDTVRAGSRNKVMVVAADCRIPAPSSDFEALFGDGAAAFLIGNDEVAVSIEAQYTVSSEFMDLWRRENDTYHHTWEDRFILAEGYAKIARKAISDFLNKNNLKAQDFTKVVFNAPDPRRHADMARALGVDAKTQLQDPLFTTVGNTGTAASPMMLVAALEEAKPGDTILWANYSDGCDVFSLRVTDYIEKIRDRRGIRGHLASKLTLQSYEKYIRFRNLMEWEPERRPPDQSSMTVLWREREQVLRCYGSKCRNCGEVQYPVQRVCAWCQTKDEYDLVRLSDRKGKIFTFSLDERAMALDLPNVIAIIDFEEGGRFYTVITDREPEALDIEQPVELTFRRLHEGHGIHNYFWKGRPVRC